MKKHFDVDSYVDELEPWMRIRFDHVRRLILTFPEVKERIRYNTPFYDYKGMMLYMGIYRKKRLVLGFCDGNLIPDEAGVLIADAGQTQVRHFELFKDRAPGEELLVQYIQQAMLVKDRLKEPQYVTKRKTGNR